MIINRSLYRTAEDLKVSILSGQVMSFSSHFRQMWKDAHEWVGKEGEWLFFSNIYNDGVKSKYIYENISLMQQQPKTK